MFNQLPSTARIWVYASARPFTPTEITDIEQKTKEFISSWYAHGNKLMADFNIVYNQFIIVAVNEEVATASGCSIDKSARLFQEIDKHYQLSLFDRSLVYYRNSKTNEVESIHDIGVAGIHRLMNNRERLTQAKVIVSGSE